MKIDIVEFRRKCSLYCALLAWAVWMGGFMFYFGVVVPLGGTIVGGAGQGFVTQQVTYRLNLIGAVAIPFLIWNAREARSRLLLLTVVLMAAFQAALFVMHYQLDLLINIPSREILDQARFSSVHELYEGLSTAMWIVAMVHLAGVVRAVREKPTPKPCSQLR